MLPVESLNGLVTFVTTARSATFTEAAETLGISRSAVGKAIARLEERLGVRLFHRTTRRISLTADGQAYFASCAAALEEIASAEACLGSASHLPAGRLRIDMPSSFGRLMILPVLLRICAEHPELQLTMTFTDHFVDPVEEGIDLLIRFGGLDQAQHLVARRLGTQQLITCASPAYLDRHGTPATVDDLHAHRSIVGYRYGQPVAWRIGEDAGQARFIPSGTHQLNDGDAVIEAAIAGLGICQMPHFLVKQHLQTGALQQVLGQCMQHHVEIHALWPQTRHLRPKVRYVVDALATLADAGAFD
ncbi:LysR substrate-binding domain-containing protein [Stenotrophomonas rhizophila]|uniref:LysR substrate-binding domain-containing protein n=1 Tax=Stenotrophomonas rhizophila TaxID=216778 RepID=UPI0010C0BF23|nr:LysR substrate-binding domain-containing protein [Stenotrophomonas rhizophila]TKK07163.1 LysR family transcriptional regulator [Stenotrophomonas rhizophila]